MKRNSALLLAGAALIAAPTLVGCGSEGEAIAQPPPVGAASASLQAEQPRENIAMARVDSAALRARIAASGTIDARRQTEISAEVSGRIIVVNVDVGDRVEAEAPLFQIDPEPYQIAVDEAQAALELAWAESRNAKEEAERMRLLVEQSVASKQQLDQLRTVARVARARVGAAGARLRRARHDLEHTEVRAPYAGSVVDRLADEGAMAGPMPIVVLQETDVLEAVLAVPEATPIPVRGGDPVRLFVEGIVEPIESVVSRVSLRVDPKTRTYEVRADVSDLRGLLKAGSYARAELEPTRTTPLPVVDESSILRRDGRTYVLRVEDGVVHHVRVRVGVREGDRFEILSGIAVGDLVVHGEAVPRLADGARVALPETETAVSSAAPGRV